MKWQLINTYNERVFFFFLVSSYKGFNEHLPKETFQRNPCDLLLNIYVCDYPWTGQVEEYIHLFWLHTFPTEIFKQLPKRPCCYSLVSIIDSVQASYLCVLACMYATSVLVIICCLKNYPQAKWLKQQSFHFNFRGSTNWLGSAGFFFCWYFLGSLLWLQYAGNSITGLQA